MTVTFGYIGVIMAASPSNAPAMRLFTSLVILLLILYAGLCLAMFLFQRSLIYFPQGRSQPAETIILPVAGAELVITHHPQPGPSAVLYFGGNAEDVSASLPTLSAAYPGHSLYLMHYRGYGGSGGAPSEAALQADARALFDKVAATQPEITLVGRSLGSGIAIALAASRPARRLVLITPYDSIEDLAAAQFPWLPVRWLIRDRYRSIDAAPRITIPTVLVQAEHDTIIPPAHTQRLLDAFPANTARRVLIAGAGHNDIDQAPGYLEAIGALTPGSAGTSPGMHRPPVPR
ncbi:MAG: PhoP [Massilia sp.]|nr:PhoP [Massilia sp.]